MRNKFLWGLWILMMLSFGLVLMSKLTDGENRSLFMPGPLTHGHQQITLACDACHRQLEDGGDGLQQSCIDCHGKVRVKPFNSHPRSKFTDPRNAELLQKIDVLQCVSCHIEHRPEITQTGGYTQPVDFCFHCHADIAEQRATHKGLAFDSCNDAGCHNFHNNRALYTDFLIKHLADEKTAERPRVPDREYARILDQLMDYPHEQYPVRVLTLADRDAPAAVTTPLIAAQWSASGHARAGVNCRACHQPDAKLPWRDRLDHRVCSNCHSSEMQTFMDGLHGMRLKQQLPPLKVGDADRPMLRESRDRTLNCVSCHGAHRFDAVEAAVEACLGCHADRHSLAYKTSVHYDLWQKELNGELPTGSGVSCATCHMPRVQYDVNDWFSRILVQHNQSATLEPNEKMLRPACLYCHGLGFSLDALADQELIEANFNGTPSVHVRSLDMAESVHRKSLEETGGELF